MIYQYFSTYKLFLGLVLRRRRFPHILDAIIIIICKEQKFCMFNSLFQAKFILLTVFSPHLPTRPGLSDIGNLQILQEAIALQLSNIILSVYKCANQFVFFF